jgi:hypothetical protein
MLRWRFSAVILLYPEQKLGNGLMHQHFVMREHGWLFAAIREAQAAGLSFGLLEAEQWMAELISIAETLDAAAHAPDVAESADVLRDRVRKMLDEHEREYACRSAIEFSDIAEWASAAARAKTNIPMPEPYLWPLIFAGSRTYISGGTGIGKTMLGISICKALRSRMPFFRYKPGNVAHGRPFRRWQNQPLSATGSSGCVPKRTASWTGRAFSLLKEIIPSHTRQT